MLNSYISHFWKIKSYWLTRDCREFPSQASIYAFCWENLFGLVHKTMAGALKKTTGLTGMLVAKDPHHTLGVLYGKILRALDRLPAEYPYRKYTESLVKERDSIVKSTPNIAELEKKISDGQVEELIIQAQNELLLARNMSVWKPWEPVEEPPPHQWDWPPHK